MGNEYWVSDGPSWSDSYTNININQLNRTVELLMTKINDLTDRVKEVEAREIELIKKLMESLDGADDKTST